jgi:hypothetical protein
MVCAGPAQALKDHTTKTLLSDHFDGHRFFNPTLPKGSAPSWRNVIKRAREPLNSAPPLSLYREQSVSREAALAALQDGELTWDSKSYVFDVARARASATRTI